MRRLLLLPALLLLVGCGSTAARPAPSPTTTPIKGYTDPASKVGAFVVRKTLHSGYVLLLIRMHNGGKSAWPGTGSMPFEDSSVAEPGTPGSIGPCDVDSSQGQPLGFQGIPAGSTTSGWIRCDYLPGTRILGVFFLNHEIGAYQIG